MTKLAPFSGEIERLSQDRQVVVGITLINQFMSALSWTQGQGIREHIVSGGGHPVRVGKPPGNNVTTAHFTADYLPDPSDPKAKLALAMHREALTVNSIPYKFLGFFKVINIGFNKGSAQIEWVRGVLPHLKSYDAQKRIAELSKTKADVAEYLYASGRCAVAHAFGDPVVNPDDPDDETRLRKDLPVARALAEWFIEHHLGVQSKQTIWSEHLYELEGFKKLLGRDLVDRLKKRGPCNIEEVPRLPAMTIRLQGKEPFKHFRAMKPEVVAVAEGRVLLRCDSSAGRVQFSLTLDVAKERLRIEPETGIQILVPVDEIALEASLDHLRFLRELLCNGILEIWEADPERLLGRCDPYVASNIDLDGTLAKIGQLEGERRLALEHLAATQTVVAAPKS